MRSLLSILFYFILKKRSFFIKYFLYKLVLTFLHEIFLMYISIPMLPTEIFPHTIVHLSLSLSVTISLSACLSNSLSLRIGLRVSFKIFTARLGLPVQISQTYFQKITFINISFSFNLSLCLVIS